MKKQTFIYLTLSLIFGLLSAWPMNPLKAQTLCVDAPTTSAGFAACNRNIAHTFAPVIVQYVNTALTDAANGDADRLVPYNYDGDWNGFNNWENAWNPSPAGVYYHVHWSENFWTITYTLHWARDYADRIFVAGYNTCADDNHEGDADKIFIVVARPDSEDADPANLAMGAGTIRHGKDKHIDIITCVDDLGTVSDADPFIGAGATHTMFGVSAGSHAIYNNHEDATLEGTLGYSYNPCQPDYQATITYLPGTTGSLVPIGGNTTETYTLIDVLEDGGLWDRRFDEETFPEWAEFACNNYCDGPGLASAPWNGIRGTDPLCWFTEKAGSPMLSCDCRDDAVEPCEDIDLACEDYIYDPYGCPELNAPFELVASSDQVCQSDGEIELTLNNLPSPMPELSWIIPDGFDIVPVAGSPANQVKLVSDGTPVLGKTPFSVIVETPNCFPKSILKIEVIQDIYNDIFTRDNNGNVQDLFCPDELVIIDAVGVTGEQAYRIKLRHRPADTNAPYVLAHNFGWIAGSMPEWFDLTNFASNNGYPLDYKYDYKVTVSVQGNCPVVKDSHYFSYVQAYGSNDEIASLVLADGDAQVGNSFCTWDEIWADGSASLYETSYSIRIFHRPVGNPFWTIFYSPPTITPGEVGLVNLSDLVATQGLSFTAGNEYQVELSLRGECYALRVAYQEFTVYNCIPTFCPIPENLRDELIEGPSLGSQLAWDPVPYATSYTVELISNNETASRCGCREGVIGPNYSVTVSTPYYEIPAYLFNSCFEWRVKANCGEDHLISLFSPTVCYSIFSGFGSFREEGETDAEKQVQAALDAKIFPNPSVGELTLELEASKAFDLSIEVYNIQGKLVKTVDYGTIGEGQFTERWSKETWMAPGMYFIYLKTSLGNVPKRVSIVR
ncbi:MAG: T9SS type A sorting domain-containing protein [Bacteroidota bacterium]